ncbi:hypothetical protein [Xanthobacter autotrophicus]|uniref:hypothetical protein n=1 Tax=Xanthobacter autotrophicus TaxID=280 RepID=UPI0037285215
MSAGFQRVLFHGSLAAAVPLPEGVLPNWFGAPVRAEPLKPSARTVAPVRTQDVPPGTF